jgi:hypothetical protein
MAIYHRLSSILKQYLLGGEFMFYCVKYGNFYGLNCSYFSRK